MKKTINFCGNCPFSYSDYNDFAVGYSTVNVCTLAQFLKLKNYCISVNNGDEVLITPEWCPLKTEEFTFGFKEFSVERKQEINSTWKEIEMLENCFDNIDDYADYDAPENVENSIQLQNLYTKLGELQNNEESLFDNEDFQNELSKNLDEIKKQLSTLEDVGNKLQESLNNIGE